MPPSEVDAIVHPAKTEVRFRQQTFVHDLVRDSVRAALLKARPVPQFTREISAQPTAAAAFSQAASVNRGGGEAADFVLTAAASLPRTAPLAFEDAALIGSLPPSALEMASVEAAVPNWEPVSGAGACRVGIDDLVEAEGEEGIAPQLASLRPLGQIRESFILAVNQEGL